MSRFEETRWSLVEAAGNSQSPDFDAALATLCQSYWYPVYSFLRARGIGHEEAEDLTQGFFSRVLEKRTLKAADRDLGRFRTFLLSALKFYVADERDKVNALKRGGGAVTASLDLEGAEERFALESDSLDSPDALYERQWAQAALERARQSLRRDVAESSHPERVILVEYLADEDRPYREVAEELEMSESAVKVAVHRLKQRLGDILRREVARTVADPRRVDDEVRHLLEVASGGN